MGRRLSGYTDVVGPDGKAVFLGPKDDVPAWAAQQITNEKAWASDDAGADSAASPAAEPEPAPEDAPEDEPEVEPETAPDPEADQTGDGDQPPPRGGAGSGRDAWAEYAAQHDVAVTDDDGRDEIIAALEAAGIPTE